MSWRWISIAAMLAALVVGYGVLVDRDAAGVSIGETPSRPGYYLKDAVITQTQADGSAGLRLIAERIEQQPKDDSIILHTVRVDYLKIPDKNWVLSAQRGFVPANSKIVEFSGDVQLRPADVPSDSFLRTDALAIDTEKSLAYSTSSPVDVKLGPHQLRVKGFSADLKDERVKLESVNGRLRPG